MSLAKYMEPFLQNLKYMLRDHKFPKKDGKAKNHLSFLIPILQHPLHDIAEIMLSIRHFQY